MAYGDINKEMDAAGEIRRNAIIFNLCMENEQPDAGRDGRTRLARPNSQARTGTQGNARFPCSVDHEQD